MLVCFQNSTYLTKLEVFYTGRHNLGKPITNPSNKMVTFVVNSLASNCFQGFSKKNA